MTTRGRGPRSRSQHPGGARGRGSRRRPGVRHKLIERLERLLAVAANLVTVVIQVAPLLFVLHGDSSVVGAAAITEQPDRISGTGTVR
jgi:hypothetical protein